MAAKKARKRAYIPPSTEVVNRKERTASSRTHRTQASPRRQRGGGAQSYEYPKPSLKRTLKRLPIYFVLIFALQYWLGGSSSRELDTQERLVLAASSAAFVTVLFAPFMHIMDKFAYGRYLKRSGQQPSADPKA